MQSTSAYNASLQPVRRHLESLIQRHLAESCGPPIIRWRDGRFQSPRAQIEVTSLESPTASTISFLLEIPVETIPGISKAIVKVHGTYAITMPLSPPPSAAHAFGPTFVGIGVRPITGTADSAIELRDQVFLCWEGNCGTYQPIPGFLCLPKRMQDELVAYAKASHGDPLSTRGGYLRMLYLSVVTITTLGFGDIVPVTDTARTLVSIEVLLGVVLAGLFLNAVTQPSQ